jgi:hypothetical protein
MPDLQQHLTGTMGLSRAVADYFTSRKRPAGNEYWLNQSTYMSTAPGYVFIPAYFDLLIRQGVQPEDLMNDDLIGAMESILQSAGKLEYRKISYDGHLEECRSILERSGAGGNLNKVENELVNRPFSTVPPRFRSLRRANTFLYTFGIGKFDFDLLFTSWELIVPLLLMLDDFSDIDKDIAEADENCLLDGGPINENFFLLNAVVEKLFLSLHNINPILANYLRSMKNEAVARNMLLIMTKGVS